MIKKVLIVLVAIVVLLIAAVALISFVMPTELKIEREVTINRPKAEVFDYVKYLKNGNEWGPWARRDPGMTTTYRGTDGQPGFVAAWVGTTDDAGVGEQEIKKITEGERIDTVLRFKEPFESRSDAYITTNALSENQTKVKWGFRSEFARPMNVFLAVMDVDAMLAKDYDEGLANLKQILERR